MDTQKNRSTISMGGYVDRCDMDRYKERIKEMEILMVDEWRLKL